jgi:hypothetical protein
MFKKLRDFFDCWFSRQVAVLCGALYDRGSQIAKKNAYAR